MNADIAFDINMQAYSARRLSLEDIGVVQGLMEKCLDYMLLVDGHPADPDEVEKEFQEVPSGNSLEDKFVFGIVNQQKDLVGLMDVVRSYPEQKIWWIGLFLFIPEVRSRGIGQKVLEGFIKYVRAHGGKAIMLGVVEENMRAYKFWTKVGFEFIRMTEPRQFGDKIQTVSIMRLNLLETE
jgi:ribosomal protein S18 acetylase RimI-like enzyme